MHLYNQTVRNGFLFTAFLCGLYVTALRAGDDCSPMTWEANTFRASVQSVEALTSETDHAPPEERMNFLITIAPEAGVMTATDGTLLVGVHDVKETFGTRDVVGRAYEFDADRLLCGGSFRRFSNIRRHSANALAEEFTGRLQVGHTYRADVRGFEASGPTLLRRIEPPVHHAAVLSWTNAGEFLRKRKHITHTVVFKVAALQIVQHGQLWAFTSTYVATLLDQQ